MKRHLSLILAVLLLITAFPFNVNASSNTNDEPKGLDVQYVSENGKDYILLPVKPTDIKVLSNEKRPRGGMSLRKITPHNPDRDGAGQLVTAAAAILWGASDWDYPTDEGYLAEILVGEGPRANTVIATAQVMQPATTVAETGTINTQFITTENYKKGDEKNKIAIRFENKIKANARVQYGDSVNNIAEGRVYYLIVTQISMPIYTAEWYDNNKATRPTVNGMIISGGNDQQEIKLPTENFKLGSVTNKEPRYVDENYMVEEGNAKSGQLIGSENFAPLVGSLTEAQLKMNKGENAVATGKFVSYDGVAEGKPFKKEVKTLDNKDGKIPAFTKKGYNDDGEQTTTDYPAYFYFLVGDNNHMWRFQMREVLQVKLNSGAGKVSDSEKQLLHVGGKDIQEIGHSEKIYNNDVELTDYIRKLYPKKGNETDEQLKRRVSDATQSQRVISFTTDETVTPPKVKVGGKDVDAVPDGWALKPQTLTDGKLSDVAAADKLVDDKGKLTPAGKAFLFKDKETTLYRVFKAPQEGKVKIAYLDDNENDLLKADPSVKINGQEYPLDKKGESGKAVTAEASEAPKFEGYALTKVDLQNAVYKDSTGNEFDTIKFIYKKKVTTTDKSNDLDYFKVTFDAKDGHFATETEKTKDVYVLKSDAIKDGQTVSFAEVKKAVTDPTKDNATFNEWQNAKIKGTKVNDDYVVAYQAGKTETFYANYSEGTMDFTAKKVWDLQGATVGEKEYPTMNFTLYRKIEGGQEEAVQGADIKEITKDVIEATWKDLPKANDAGKEYTYSVKETFKDSDIRNDNWIKGAMVTTTENQVTTNSITNKLKTVAAPGQNPDDTKNFVGKLTVKKVLENEPVVAKTASLFNLPMRAPAANDPIKFKFKVTGPYGYSQEFELEAGKEKELTDLAYGEYTVQEIESNGYTAKYVDGKYTKGQSELKDNLTVTLKNADNEKEKTVTVVNQNLETPNKNFVTLKATKIWVNGPTTDHKEVTIKVFRQVGDEAKEPVTIENPIKLNVTRDKTNVNEFKYTWTNLPKHDKDGKPYTYSVEEDRVATDAQTQEKVVTINNNTYVVKQNGNTITNTYKTPLRNIEATKIWKNGPTEDHTQATLNLFRQVEGGQKAKVEGVTPEVTPDAASTGTFNYTWKDLPVTDDAGKEYTYTVEEEGATTAPNASGTAQETTVKVRDNTYVVTIDNDTNTVTNTFKADGSESFTVKKVWADDVTPVPTMNFTLYRKVQGSNEDPVKVQGAEVKEITKTTTEATWTGLEKTDANGVAYEYSVKETFKEENADVKNANWKLGEMADDGNGNKTITNKLKIVPGDNDTPDEKVHRMGKLTITKKIESKVTQPQMSRARAKAPAAPLAFTFKVTDPYGNVVKVDGQDTFTLKANETKTLENLLYGEYTVEEIDAKGLTPFVKVGDGDETESKTGKVTLKKDAKEGTVTFTNKNINSLTNPNVIEVKASKVWENGPSTDHAAVTLKLYRQVGDGTKVEVTDVTPEVTRVVSGGPIFNYVWKNLPKINDKGEEYTYTVEEANTTTTPATPTEKAKTTVKFGENTYVVTQEGNTITNTYEVPKTAEDVIGKKEWKDVPDGTATPVVKLELWRKTSANPDGEKAKDAMALTNNQADFGKQDKTDENGNEYTYFVKEVDENGNAFSDANYTSTVDGLTATNIYKTTPAPVTYTVSFDNKGHGTAPAAQTVEAGKKATEPAALTAQGYDFGGWYTDENFEYKYNFATPVNSNITLYAKWTEKTVTPQPQPETFTIKYISMDTNMGKVSNAKDTGDTTTGTINGSTATANEGYEFVHWLGTDGKTYNTAKLVPTEKKDATYIAIFKAKAGTPAPNKIQILYIPADNTRGSVNPAYEEVATGGTILGSTATAKSGYKFLQWIDKDGKPVSTDAKYTPVTDVSAVYVAMFEKDTTVTPNPPTPPTPSRPSVPERNYYPVPGPIVEVKTVTEVEIGRHYKYLYGYVDKTVRPEGMITRSEAAALIARLAELDMSDKTKPNFKDTPSAWYNSAINAMVRKNLMFADKNGNFRPNEPITRGEFARALYYIDKKNDKVAPFADVKGHKFEAAINQAYGNGRIAGYPDGTFKPDAKIQRAEAARILNQYADRNVTLAGMANVKRDLVRFTDINESHWAYCEVMEAANSHEYQRAKGTLAETWLKILDK